MIKIRSQFLGIALSGWVDEYEMQSSKSEEETVQVVADILKAPAVGRNFEGAHVFRRGSRFWTWFSYGSERIPLQEISVRFEEGVVILRYQIMGGVFVRIKPCGLEDEAREIASFLKHGESKP